jgi:hypothetical protein
VSTAPWWRTTAGHAMCVLSSRAKTTTGKEKGSKRYGPLRRELGQAEERKG